MCGRAHARQVVGAVVGVVGDDEGARPEAAFHQPQDIGIKRLGAVEQKRGRSSRADRAPASRSASPSRISTRSMRPPAVRLSRARATLDGSNSVVIRRPPPLSRSAAARCRVEMPNEVPNSTIVRAPRASRQHVEQRAGLARDGERNVLQPPVEVAVIGLAPQQARPLLGGEIGEGGAVAGAAAVGLVEQAVQQGRKRGGGRGWSCRVSGLGLSVFLRSR